MTDSGSIFLDRVLRPYMIASQADKAMAKIAELKAGLLLRRASSRNVLRASEALVNECGEAIARWFGSLSGPALDAAIFDAFKKFDLDDSGSIDRCACVTCTMLPSILTVHIVPHTTQRMR